MTSLLAALLLVLAPLAISAALGPLAALRERRRHERRGLFALRGRR